MNPDEEATNHEWRLMGYITRKKNGSMKVRVGGACGCGWKGPQYFDTDRGRELAAADADRHQEKVWC